MNKLGQVMGAALLVLGGWVAGSATGCSKAHADESKVCPAPGPKEVSSTLVFELPDNDPATVARASIMGTNDGGQSYVVQRDLAIAADGKVRVSCREGATLTLVTW